MSLYVCSTNFKSHSVAVVPMSLWGTNESKWKFEVVYSEAGNKLFRSSDSLTVYLLYRY